MTPFPVTDSTLSAPHLALFLQEKYGFDEGTTCRIFRTGINHTYLVAAGGLRYVFRVYSYQWRTETEIAEELRLLNLLRENEVSVSYPIEDKNQNYIQPIPAPEGLRYGVLFSFAEGQKIRNLHENTCESIGTLMARMHQGTLNLNLKRVDYTVQELAVLPYQYAKKYYDESLEEMQFVKKAGGYLATFFAQADTSQLRKGVVHLDLWYDNMNIVDDSDITLFDFDFCGNGWLFLDVSYFVVQLFNTEPDKERYTSKLNAFYRGYQAITPLTEEEKRLIPYAGLAIWLFYLGVQSRRFDNWSNIFLTENYLKHFIGLIIKWLDFNGADPNLWE
ncbi:phosphotransferase [Salmonirosea aquatica]|uniref:Phosphotransferase n=1 Tax=Salmonirosea aquatica TaxID=2654236 RepID=A0A7C9BFB6_9BACT|nr:phosphotransferase [Cytophagaceae bacterium SJW1-29]